MFNAKAKWIWDNSDRRAYHHYIQARRPFTVTAKQLAGMPQLLITADSYYQVSLNGRVVGHGPAKSAHNTRSVDTYDLRNFLQVGDNTLDITALCAGVGMMTYCCGDAGLIYQLNLGKQTLVSDAKTMVRPDPTRQKTTARRWIMPCTEDVDAAGLAKRTGWKPATIVKNADVKLYPRRVPLPSREVLVPKRMVDVDQVKLPNVNVSFIIKPYVVNCADRFRCNTHEPNAYVVSHIHSPVNQTLTLAPALANVAWYVNGEHLITANGWSTSVFIDKTPTVKLNKGTNLLVGVCKRTHFEDITLAGFTDKLITFKNPFGKGMFSFIHMDKEQEEKPITGKTQLKTDWQNMPGRVKDMNPAHSLNNASGGAMTEGVQIIGRHDSLLADATLDTVTLPAAKAGTASRTIIDLGVLHNGYLCFDVESTGESRIIFNMFEAIKEDPHVVIHQTGINNALTYHTAPTGGYERFESFFAYGVRYIAICHTGNKPVTLKNLRVLTANSNMIAQGSFQTDDPMLNAIYKQGVQSQLTGMDDTYTDCPTFEQVNWNYDNRVTAMANYVTFASDAITQNSIRLFTEDPGFQGMVRSQYPSEWENFIPLWSFHWIMWVRDYWWQSGNAKFAKDMMPCIARGLADALNKRNELGLFSMHGVWHFVDWANGRDDNHDVNTAEQGGLLGALQAAIQLGKAIGKSQSKQVATWQREYDALKAAVNKHLWCEQRKAYADALLEDGSHSPVSSMVTNAALCLYGATDDKTTSKLAKQIAAGPQAGLVDYGSPLGIVYITELFDKLGMVKDLMKLIVENWGPMVLQGDSCGWEHFLKGRPQAYWPTRSRCHPCSAVALKYLARWVLGLEQLAPGWTKFAITPPNDTGITLNRVWGSIPTPSGLIRVSSSLDTKGRFQAMVQAPKECKPIKAQ
jgi:hypothetical protein